ncbi:MAG: hypothetical protein J5I91_10060 [Bacteroidetes bacterium]|nr:hypothetical protein [Bacteroidota bacterium]
MKNVILLLLIIPLIFVQSSCKKGNKKLITIPVDMSFNTPYATPEILDIDTQLVLETYRFPTGIDAYLVPKNSAKELLQDVFLDKMDMAIVLNDSTTFDILKDIDVYLSADGMKESLGAYLHDVPQNHQSSISLTPSGNNMKEYLKKDEIFLVIKLILRKPLPKSTYMTIKTKFKGSAGVL